MSSRGRSPQYEARTSRHPDASHTRVAGLILAAGQSRRMGRPKTDLVLEGRTLLQHVIDNALASKLQEVVVVLRREDEAGRLVVEQRSDERLRGVIGGSAEEGQSASLRAGLRALDSTVDAAAILLADQPGVNAGLIDRMLDEASSSACPATRPVHLHEGKRTPGHPVILARRIFSATEALNGDQGARQIFQEDESSLNEVEIHTPPPLDVDTSEDYQELCREVLQARH